MSNSTLKVLLKEYEQKRDSSFLSLEKRKEELYKSCPRLEQIDLELNNFALNTAKSILNSDSSYSLKELQEKIDSLNIEKHELLNSLTIILSISSIISNKVVSALFRSVTWFNKNSYLVLTLSYSSGAARLTMPISFNFLFSELTVVLAKL